MREDFLSMWHVLILPRTMCRAVISVVLLSVGITSAASAVCSESGTATLETALVKRPMVVAYRVAPLTGWLLREMKLVKTDYFSQPNLLAGRQLVPEYFQEQVRPEILGPALLEQLERADRAELVQEFRAIHESLRRDANERAAEAICELLAARQRSR